MGCGFESRGAYPKSRCHCSHYCSQQNIATMSAPGGIVNGVRRSSREAVVRRSGESMTDLMEAFGYRLVEVEGLVDQVCIVPTQHVVLIRAGMSSQRRSKAYLWALPHLADPSRLLGPPTL